MALAVKVPISEAERCRRSLMERGLIDFSRRPRREGDEFIIPVNSQVDGYEMVDVDLPETAVAMDLRESLTDELSDDELERLKTAYDLVGDIAILEIDEDLRSHERLIGQKLLSLFPSIEVVVRKAGAHQGELRTQDYVHLAGEERFDTLVVENGVRMRLDIRKTYYSVRSSTERKRIASLVQPGERVLVMFSGMGPFVLVIAKHSEASEVVGVELNGDAHRFAERNIAMNKLGVRAHVLHGDVREVVPNLGRFDRIAMPLPHTAQDFLDIAVAASDENAMIHLYHFSTEEEVQAFASTIPARIEDLGRHAEVEHIERCGNLAPGVHRWSIDIRLQD